MKMDLRRIEFVVINNFGIERFVIVFMIIYVVFFWKNVNNYIKLEMITDLNIFFR